MSKIKSVTYDVDQERRDVCEEGRQGEDGTDTDDNASHNAYHVEVLQV